MSPELKKLWMDYQRAVANAWIADCNPNTSVRRLNEAWDKEKASREAFEQALDVLAAFNDPTPKEL